MNPFVLLFDFRGRINRAKFWLAVLIYAAILVTVVGVTIVMTDSLSVALSAMFVAYIPVTISGIAVGIKRLHDRDKSGWWLLLFYGVPLLLNAFSLSVFGGDDTGLAAQVVLYVSFAINIWALIEFGCLRGTIGPNQHGPDPIAPAPNPQRAVR